MLMTNDKMQSVLAEPRFRLLILFVVLLFIGLSLLIFKAFSSYQHTQEKTTQLQQHADAILYFDEVLTMSARMAAFTGKQYWEVRYHACVPKLDLALQNTLALFPDAQEALEATREANLNLIDLELQALRLASKGQLRQASEILFSPDYEKDKKIYSAGLTRLQEHITAYKNTIQNQIRRSTQLSLGVAALMFLFIVLVLVYILRLLDSRLKLEAMTSNLSRHFIQHSQENIESNIQWALQLLACQSRANHCYLLNCAPQNNTRCPIEWRFPAESPSLLSAIPALAEKCQAWLQSQRDHNGIWYWPDRKTSAENQTMQKTILKTLHSKTLLGASTARTDGDKFMLVLASGRRNLKLGKADSDLLHTIIEIIMRAIENKNKENDLLRLATTDALTGIANRRHFSDQLRNELMRVQRTRQASALMMLDIDFFKHVNDSYGHTAGDAVLSHVALYAQTRLRQIDIIGRIGGEEFCVIVPNRDAENALIAAERLRLGIENEVIATDAGPIHITVSIGVTLLKSDDQLESAMKRVDAALYIAKNNGRNRIQLV
jgi:diguanylate cyclase (GGDEF) domain